MMGLELVVSVEHFNADGWADSEEYRTRYPAKVVAARMVDGLKLLRYAKEATFKTPERRYLCIASRECDGDHAPDSAKTYLSKDERSRKERKSALLFVAAAVALPDGFLDNLHNQASKSQCKSSRLRQM